MKSPQIPTLVRTITLMAAVILSVEVRGDDQLYGIKLELVEDSATRLEFTLNWHYSEVTPFADTLLSQNVFVDAEDHPSTGDRVIQVLVVANGLQGLPLSDTIGWTFSFWLPNDEHPFTLNFSDASGLNPVVAVSGDSDQLLFTHTIQPLPIYSRITLDADSEFGTFVFSSEPVPERGASVLLFAAGMTLLFVIRRQSGVRRGVTAPYSPAG